MNHEELMKMSKEYLIAQAELFRRGLLMWQAAYKEEVGGEKYQEFIDTLAKTPEGPEA